MFVLNNSTEYDETVENDTAQDDTAIDDPTRSERFDAGNASSALVRFGDSMKLLKQSINT